MASSTVLVKPFYARGSPTAAVIDAKPVTGSDVKEMLQKTRCLGWMMACKPSFVPQAQSMLCETPATPPGFASAAPLVFVRYSPG
ncbi:hypothetical protein [Massilia sp. METH4]|uniref:hypothetical protein n=1 Tax=Massilia sp. METH4 TaxID=3123041 RepID=UPI0030D2520D